MATFSTQEKALVQAGIWMVFMLQTAFSTEIDQNQFLGGLCSEEDINVQQGQTAPLQNGIPTYTVVITNVCASRCNISGIHLSCGWFSSARMINPKVFKRLSYDDCLVNNGDNLAYGASISFMYANTFKYPLSVSTVQC